MFVITNDHTRKNTLQTLGKAAKKIGISETSRRMKTARGHVYEIAFTKSNPTFEALVRFCNAIGYEVCIRKKN